MASIFVWLRYVSSSKRSITFSFLFVNNKRCWSCLVDKRFALILFTINSSSSEENDVVSNIETNSSKKRFDGDKERNKSDLLKEIWDSVDKVGAVDEDSIENKWVWLISFGRIIFYRLTYQILMNNHSDLMIEEVILIDYCYYLVVV